MSITLTDIKKLADLSRIEMTESEMNGLIHDFGSILAYVDQVNQVELLDVSAKPLVVNATHADTDANESGTYLDKMIADAPDAQNGFYKVPKIL